jgi:hypothetical protein
MPTFTAWFRTDAEWAIYDFEADTPEQALQMAHDLWRFQSEELSFQSYDMMMPVDEIEISGPEGAEIAVWHSPEMRLRLAASDLLEALEQAVAALNTVPRFQVPSLATDSYRIAVLCDRAIAKAKPKPVA